MRIAVLAVQGAFLEHENILRQLGAECVELRNRSSLAGEFDGLVLPGGESTVQGKLLKELGMFEDLRERLEAGMPVLATCAGLILLAQKLANDERTHFQTAPIVVERNAFGRQLGSFHCEGEIAGIGAFPMEFIRAPYIKEAGDGVEVLARVEDKIVGMRYKNQLGFAFHPEVTNDTRLHEMFLNIIREQADRS